MIDFMLIGLPRSATTWAANWLTTDATHCVHDPLYTTHYTDWDTDTTRFPSRGGLHVGVSCTGIWRWPDWVNSHPAKKVILHREYVEVHRSMEAIGLPPVEPEAVDRLRMINGLHVDYKDLFDPDSASRIWEHLTGLPFNAARHRELVKIEMQPEFTGISVGREVTKRLMEELNAIYFS